MLQHLVLADVCIWALGYLLTILIIKLVAAAALNKVLPDSVQVKDRGLPASGRQGLMALPTTLVCWLATAFFASAQPEWLLNILRKLGMG